MEEHYDPDAEDSEFGSGRRYGPVFPAPIINGNYTKIVVAWASLITLILVSTFAYLWNVRDSRDERQDMEIMTLWADRAQDRETIGRMEAHLEFLQRQVDKMQK